MRIDFSNPEQFRELEKQAYHGTLEISDFPPCEYKYFAQLREIYYAYKFKGLAKSEAETMKRKLYSQYRNEKHDYDYYFRFVADWNANIRKSGTYRSEICKSSDIVEKFRFAVQCIGAMTGDYVFTRTELEKLENQKGEPKS